MKLLIVYLDKIEGAIREMTPQQKGLLFQRLVDYTKGEDKKTGDPGVDMVFNVLEVDLKLAAEKYDSICHRNKVNGQKGGRPPKPKETEKNPENPVGFSKTQQNPENLIKENKINKINNITPNGVKLSSTDNPVEPAEKIDLIKLLNYWNEQVFKHNSILNRVKTINGNRKVSVFARLRENGKEAIQTVIDKATASDFLNGKNDRGWTANFDWIFMRPNNFQKVLEGNYDNKNISTTTTADSNSETASARVDRLLGLSNNDEPGSSV